MTDIISPKNYVHAMVFIVLNIFFGVGLASLVVLRIIGTLLIIGSSIIDLFSQVSAEYNQDR